VLITVVYLTGAGTRVSVPPRDPEKNCPSLRSKVWQIFILCFCRNCATAFKNIATEIIINVVTKTEVQK